VARCSRQLVVRVSVWFPRQGLVIDVRLWELPDDLPLVERSVVRLVVLDTADQVLLFHTRDPTYPDLGDWWELPGGGIEAGETYLEAAIRELHEETGIDADPVQVGAPTWRRHATFRYRGERRLQHEAVVTVHLATAAPSVSGALRVGYENEDYFDYRWWPVAEITESVERFYPSRLPELVRAHLDGQHIDEPYEVWS
jgi:8-oxo-dGTP pyrophosphatase MutT (NUDIX family)